MWVIIFNGVFCVLTGILKHLEKRARWIIAEKVNQESSSLQFVVSCLQESMKLSVKYF